MKTLLRPYRQFCAQLRSQNLLRGLPLTSDLPFDFSTNDYLGLSVSLNHDKSLLADLSSSAVGAKASRLIMPDQSSLTALEHAVASAKNTPAALIFATGFQANVSVIQALLDPKVLGKPARVFSDKLIHASLLLGLRTVEHIHHRFRHADMEHLEYLLKKTAQDSHPKFILTESVFGMDGDLADLERLIQLAHDYKAMLYVDEAHATGLFGPQGYGCSTLYPGNTIPLVMGTFSKALGTSGAYVACSREIKRYLINRASGLIYSTALSPLQTQIMHHAWMKIPTLQPKVKALMAYATRLRATLTQQGFDIGHSETNIIPIILKSAKSTLAAQQQLLTQGIRVGAIRPPSVPQNTSRLRIALSLAHTPDAIDYLETSLSTLPL